MQHLFLNILKERRCARKSSDRSPVINHRQGPIKMFVKSEYQVIYKYFRVQKELKQLQSLQPHGIQVTLPSDSLQLWEALVPGPEDSLYRGEEISLFGLSNILFKKSSHYVFVSVFQEGGSKFKFIYRIL